MFNVYGKYSNVFTVKMTTGKDRLFETDIAHIGKKIMKHKTQARLSMNR